MGQAIPKNRLGTAVSAALQEAEDFSKAVAVLFLQLLGCRVCHEFELEPGPARPAYRSQNEYRHKCGGQGLNCSQS